MSQTVIQQLESCAQMLLAPPECVTYEERNRAQQVFIDFQKTKLAFDMCRDILENSCVPFVQFQCGCCLKNGVIRDWSSLSAEQRQLLLTYLNDYVNSRCLQPFVCEQLLLVCAIILKRIAIDEGNDSQTLTQILTYLFEMIANESSAVNSRLVACTSVLSLLNEYSSSTRATDFGLPWATHLRAKKKFENTHLKSIFRCVVTTLVSHIRISEENRNDEWFTLSTKLLRICDFILSWNFDVITIFSSQYAKHVDSIENPVLQPAIDWKEVLLDGDVISIFFEIHLHLRSFGNEKIIHYSMQCLNQLSSLNGPIIINADNRSKFVTTIVNGTIELVKRICDTIMLAEVVPITSIINRICIRLQCRDQINYVEIEMLKSFLELMAQMSCNLMLESLKCEDDEQFDKYKLANDNMFNSWMAIINTLERANRRDDTDLANTVRNQEMIKLDSLTNWTRAIFETFLKIHLSQPLGMRKKSVEIEDDIQEFEDNDIKIFSEQLNAIGCIARIDAAHSINCLIQLFSIILERFESCIQRESQTHQNSEDWVNLNEDIHWLVLISSFLLTQSNFGERELIPSQIMSLSIDSQSDITQSVIALQNFDITANSIDPVVRIIINLFKICSIEKCLCENDMTHLLSPQVSLSLTMFITRFMSTYLLPNENDYNEMSMTLNSCFGRDSLYANNTLNFIIDHIIVKLLHWPSEAQVTEESSLSLVIFAKNCSERCKSLNNCINLNKLLEKHMKNELQNMSINTRKNIYQVFVYIVTYKQELYNQLFQPLLEKYKQICAGIESNNTSEQMRGAVIELCESMEGIACGTTAVNVSTVWSNFISPIFNDLAKILHLFHNYNSVVLSILNLLSQLANRILCYLSDSDVVSFYNCSMAILNEYAKFNCGRISRESSSEEESYNDILIILNFLNDLAAKDFIEWFHDTSTEQPSMNAIQVVFIGLNIIMPLMSEQLLEFPKLCQSYYKLIVFLCEDPDRLQLLPNHLMQSIMQSVQLALKSTFGNEVKSNCLTMLSVLGGHTMREPNKFHTVVRLLEPFLSIIFEFTLMECGTSNDVTMRESVANALFSLICCFPSRYQELAHQLISQVKSESVQNQLRSTFEKLMEGLFLDGTRVHRAMFKRRFETFVIEIQGLLCIK